jgi:protein involved in polysaccharide export with SLBB domain
MVHVEKSLAVQKNPLVSRSTSVVLTFLFLSISFTHTIAQTPVPYFDRIHQGDVIEIDEMGGFEYDWRGQLNPEGLIDTLPKIAEPILARCLTTEALASAIVKEYRKFLREPVVRVRILDRTGRSNVFLYGAIRQPAQFHLKREIRLSELLIQGGGLTDRAGGNITVLEDPVGNCGANSEQTKLTSIRITDILAGIPTANPLINSGDIISVEPVLPFYVVGGVNRPGRNAWRQGLTVSRAVASAGGVSGKGVSGNATIYRRDSSGPRTIAVDLKRAASDPKADLEILANDIIEIPLSGESERISPSFPEEPIMTASDRTKLPLRIID